MFAKKLKCVSCNTEYPLEALYECKSCGGILEVVYDYDGYNIEGLKNFDKELNREDYFPIKKGNYVYNGEGNTPLINSSRLGNRLEINELFLKLELCNPTGSFKDRPVAVGISKAAEFGYDKLVVASSGNGAAAVASYCAKAGLKARILVPESTPDEKVRQATYYGGDVIKVPGVYSDSYNLAKKMSEDENLYNVTTTFLNPYTVEGDKIVAYELFKQLKGRVPDYIFVPIGAGPLLVGIYKGFKELFGFGLINKIPKMVGVQAEGCSPIARAYLNGQDEVKSDDNPKTIAGGICDGLTGYSKDGTYTLNIIRKSNGFAIYVSDSEIVKAQSDLAKYEGIFVEPSSAATIAAIKKGLQEEELGKDNLIVSILTGHGLKDMKSINV